MLYLLVADDKEFAEDTGTGSEDKEIATPKELESSSQLYRCCICNKDYPNIPCMVRHIKYHMSRKKVSHCEQCRHCDKAFTTKQQLVRHEASHQDVRPFQCEQCDKFFKTADSVKRHMYVHSDEKPFSCHICHKEFKAKHLMKKHEETHSDAKNYECPKCGKKFKARNSLRDHLLVHNGTRPYKCEECNQAFYRRSHLATHKTIHSEIKPFSCNVCGKSFGRREHLKVHQRIHSGERPFHCNQCERSFNQQAGLQAHLVSHSDERPYTCLRCKKSFKYQSQIKHHACKPDVIGPCMVNVHDNICTREEENFQQTPSDTKSTSEDSQGNQTTAADISSETSDTEDTIILIQIENTPHSDEEAMSIDIETTGIHENNIRSRTIVQKTVIPRTNVETQLMVETNASNIQVFQDSGEQNIATLSKEISESGEPAANTQINSKRKASAIATSQTRFSPLSSNLTNVDIPETRVILTETRVQNRHENNMVETQPEFTSCLGNMKDGKVSRATGKETCMKKYVNIASTPTRYGSTQENITDTSEIVPGTQTRTSVNQAYVGASAGITLENQAQPSGIVWSRGEIETVANDARTAEQGAMQLLSYQFQQPAASFGARADDTTRKNEDLQSGSPPNYWNQR